MWLELEPVIVLLNFYDFAVGRIECAVGAAVLFCQKAFFFRGIKPFVGLLIKFPGGVQFGEDGLDEVLVAGAGGADEIVVGQFEFLRERLPIRGESVAVSLRRFAIGLGGLLDFLAVFIKAGEEKNFLSKTAPGAGDDVGDDLFVGVAEMRLPVDVIDRGGDIKRFTHPTDSVTEQDGVGNCSGTGGDVLRLPGIAKQNNEEP